MYLKTHKRLLYISKSKKGTAETCMQKFKYNYIDKSIEKAPNPYFILGNDVHDFIEKLFKIIKPLDDGNIEGISTLKFHPNTPYKKNVVKFEIQRWQEIQKAGFDSTYFMPVQNEKMWKTENPKLIGVVDRVHKCCKVDVLAPKHPEFKDGDLVIVENKTGKPTAAKCRGYEEDMLWYKIIIEIVLPELAPIRWGTIYFPFDNYVYHCELKKEDCKVLAQDIRKVREKIKSALETGLFPATPSKSGCFWCDFKNGCPVVIR